MTKILNFKKFNTPVFTLQNVSEVQKLVFHDFITKTTKYPFIYKIDLKMKYKTNRALDHTYLPFTYRLL